jgi:hypothetical protein
VLGHHAAGVGEDQVPPGSLDESHAEHRLQGGDVLRHGSGGVAQVVRSSRQGASALQLVQRAELDEVEPGPRSHGTPMSAGTTL